MPQMATGLQQFQETLDYFEKHFKHSHSFTFLFDFSKCQEFLKVSMLGEVKKFLTKNDDLITSNLKESYILLRSPLWKFVLDIIFKFRPPKRPYHLAMHDTALYNSLRYQNPPYLAT